MNSVDSREYLDGSGRVEARYLAFLETVSTLRPSLHRYCARMTGSIMDGEDVVQEALIEAYRKLDKYDESRALKPWLFRIAHNRSIDFLRRKGVSLLVAVRELLELCERLYFERCILEAVLQDSRLEWKEKYDKAVTNPALRAHVHNISSHRGALKPSA